MSDKQLFDDLASHLADKIAKAFKDVCLVAPNNMRPSLSFEGAKIALECAVGVTTGTLVLSDDDDTADRVFQLYAAALQSFSGEPAEMKAAHDSLTKGLMDLFDKHHGKEAAA